MFKASDFLKKGNLVKAGDRVLVAVSGGADSIALSHLFVEHRARLGIQICLAHYNHKTRKSADIDQRFVEKFAKRFSLGLVVECRSKEIAKSLLSEEKARDLRLDFLVRTARQWKADAVVLAHTADDLAETVLMRLIRGAGLHGLRGILPKREMQGVCFIRPLLDVNRVDIERYLQKHKISFRNDNTNFKPVYLRNKIRLELLPLLAKEYNPSISKALTKVAYLAQDDYDFLCRESGKRFKENLVRAKGIVKIALSKINNQHPAMQRMLFRQMAQCLKPESMGLDFSHIMELEELLSGKTLGAQVHLPQGMRAFKNNKYLEFRL